MMMINPNLKKKNVYLTCTILHDLEAKIESVSKIRFPPSGVFVIYLTFHSPRKSMDLKNRMHQCLKLNKRQQKYHTNCVSVMPERRVTTKCVGVLKIYNDGSFQAWRVGGE